MMARNVKRGRVGVVEKCTGIGWRKVVAVVVGDGDGDEI
jgi:hypothetical protein